MGMFFHSNSGVLYIFSKSDERWCVSIKTKHVTMTSSWFQEIVAELTEKYGDPPEDLEYGGVKD